MQVIEKKILNKTTVIFTRVKIDETKEIKMKCNFSEKSEVTNIQPYGLDDLQTLEKLTSKEKQDLRILIENELVEGGL